MAGCYKVSPHGYKELAPITLNAASDTINVNLGTELVYTGLDIASSKDFTCEWAYGKPKDGTQISDHKFDTMEVISESRTIDYKFSKVGSFILRLKVDNGESIKFKYFTLNVNSGYDEGVAILSNDSEGNGSLAFVKTLTQEDIVKGEQQVFSNIFSVEGMTLKNGTGMYIGHNSYKGTVYSGLVIATNDENGTIYHMDCKTLELFMTVKMSSYGTHCVEFGGEYAEDKASFGCFFRSADNRVFRYDLNGGFINEMTDVPYRVDRIISAVNKGTSETAKTVRVPYFFNADQIGMRKTSSAGVKTMSEDGWEVVNVGVARSSGTNMICVLFRNKTDKTSYMIKQGNLSWTYWGTTKDENNNTIDIEHKFTSSDLKMDRNSKIIGTLSSSDVYYTYDNAIYRWNLTSAPGIRPAINVPSGEIIRDIATNHMGRNAHTGENLLYVATYNPSRSGEHKGSLYVFRFSDDTMVAKYEGICDDPASVIYKYRIN